MPIARRKILASHLQQIAYLAKDIEESANLRDRQALLKVLISELEIATRLARDMLDRAPAEIVEALRRKHQS